MNNNCHQQQDVYADILKACQSFYELPRNPYASALKISPRLEDGLSEMNSSNRANPQDPVMDAIQYDDCCMHSSGTLSDSAHQN
mmetsp:Transcript_28552/g.69200  ORF Transcript_28552/g.69200 Transcript_28552/m.69200 type:complete len:84 (-) Transcript_28552:197-448(-)